MGELCNQFVHACYGTAKASAGTRWSEMVCNWREAVENFDCFNLQCQPSLSHLGHCRRLHTEWCSSSPPPFHHTQKACPDASWRWRKNALCKITYIHVVVILLFIICVFGGMYQHLENNIYSPSSKHMGQTVYSCCSMFHANKRAAQNKLFHDHNCRLRENNHVIMGWYFKLYIYMS